MSLNKRFLNWAIEQDENFHIFCGSENKGVGAIMKLFDPGHASVISGSPSWYDPKLKDKSFSINKNYLKKNLLLNYLCPISWAYTY